MAEIKKIENKFFVEFFGNGLKFQKFAGYSRQDADKLKKQIEDSLSSGGDIYKDRFVSLENFFIEFENDITGRYSEISQKRIKRALSHFKSYLQSNEKVTHVQDITPRVIEGYRGEVRKACEKRFGSLRPGVINLTLYILEVTFGYAAGRGYLNDNPLLHVPYMSTDKTGHKGEYTADVLEKYWTDIRQSKDKEGLLTLRNICNVIPGEKDPVKLRNSMIVYLLEKGISVNVLSEHVAFSDVARWAPYLPFIKKGC